MDFDDYVIVDEILELYLFFKEDFVGRIVELIKEKKEFWKKLYISLVVE